MSLTTFVKLFSLLVAITALLTWTANLVDSRVESALDRRLLVLEYRMCELEKVVRGTIGLPPPDCS